MNNELYYKNKYLKYKIKYIYEGGAFKKLDINTFKDNFDIINKKYLDYHNNLTEIKNICDNNIWNENKHNNFKLILSNISKKIIDEYNEYNDYKNNNNYDIYNLINIIINNIEQDNTKNIKDFNKLKLLIFLFIIYKKSPLIKEKILNINGLVYKMFEMFINNDNITSKNILKFISILFYIDTNNYNLDDKNKTIILLKNNNYILNYLFYFFYLKTSYDTNFTLLFKDNENYYFYTNIKYNINKKIIKSSINDKEYSNINIGLILLFLYYIINTYTNQICKNKFLSNDLKFIFKNYKYNRNDFNQKNLLNFDNIIKCNKKKKTK